jgi:hypothetical protein
MMNQAWSDASLAHRHGQGVQRQLLIGPSTHGPADRTARIQVQEHRHIEPAGSRRHMRDVAHPHPIQLRCDKSLLEPIEGKEKGSGVFVDRLVRLWRTSPSPKRRW